MEEFEQSDLDKETNDSHNTCYQNAICYQEKENAFQKNLNVVYFLVFVIKLEALWATYLTRQLGASGQ